jgi:hypothetical protein
MLSSLPVDYTKSKQAITANKESIDLIGTTTIPFRLGQHDLEHSVYLTENLCHELVLGLDFLSEHACHLNFEEGLLELAGCDPIPLEVIHYLDTEVKLRANSTVVIQPWSQQLVWAKLESDQSVGLTQGVVIPNPRLTGRSHLMGAHSIVEVKNNLVPYLMYNPTARPVKLYRCTNLGQLDLRPSDIVANLGLSSEVEGHGQASLVEQTRIARMAKTDPPAVSLDGADITSDQRQTVEELLMKYRHVFANDNSELGRTSVLRHRIDTGNSPPIRSQPYRVGPTQRHIINEQVHDMLEKGVISESKSAWSSPVVLVKKSDGSTRFCVDLRKCNAVSTGDAYFLPRIDDTLDALGESQPKFFSTLDLRSGYWQVELDGQDSRDRSAFVCHSGLYEFNVMCFGQKSAPSTFQRLMESVLRGLNQRICLVQSRSRSRNSRQSCL